MLDGLSKGMTRRSMLKWLGLGTAGAFLAGCGGAAAPTATTAPAAKPAATTAPAAAATTAPAAPAATAVAPAAPKAKEPVTVTFTSQGNPTELKMFDAIIDGFTAAQKDIKVDKKYDTTMTWPKSINMMRSKTASDVHRQDDDSLWSLVAGGTVEELDTYFARDLKKSDYYEKLVFEQRLGPGGTLASGYVASYPFVLICNKAIFAKKGIKLPTNWTTDAWTIDDFEKVCAEVSEVKDGRVNMYAASIPNWMAAVPAYNHGMEYWDKDETKSTWSSEAGIDFFKKWQSWFTKKWMVPPGENIAQLFNSGLLAMRAGAAIDALGVQKDVDLELAPFWKGKVRNHSSHGGRNFIIPSFSKNKEAAWELMKYFWTQSADGKSGGQAEIAKVDWGLPTLKAAATGPIAMDPNKRYKNTKMLVEAMDLPCVPYPRNPACEQWMIAQRRLDSLNLSKMTVEEYLKVEADEFMTNILKENEWNKSKDVKGYRFADPEKGLKLLEETA